MNDEFHLDDISTINLIDLDTQDTITVRLDENNRATLVETLDEIKNPSHYKKENGIETIEFIKAVLTPEQFTGYLLGNCIKYASRFNEKDTPIKNAIKIDWYSEFLEQFLIAKKASDEKKD